MANRHGKHQWRMLARCWFAWRTATQIGLPWRKKLAPRSAWTLPFIMMNSPVAMSLLWIHHAKCSLHICTSTTGLPHVVSAEDCGWRSVWIFVPHSTAAVSRAFAIFPWFFFGWKAAGVEKLLGDEAALKDTFNTKGRLPVFCFFLCYIYIYRCICMDVYV